MQRPAEVAEEAGVAIEAGFDDRPFAMIAESEERDKGGATEDRPDAGFEAATQAEENDRRRRKAGEWLKSRPLASMLVVRLTLEPLRDYLSHQLVLASRAWEENQQVREARALLADDGAEAPLREFKLIVLAKGMLGQTYGDKQRALMFEPQLVVNLLHDMHKTLRVRNLLSGCCRPAHALFMQSSSGFMRVSH